MSSTLSPNTTLAHYMIVAKIGEGGMGEVYRARDPKLDRDVAIKVLPAALSADKDRLARFEQEAQAAGGLNHPNILVIHHIGTYENAPYIVSELLQGETLRERMAGGALQQRKAIDYALQIAKGLAAAHDKGIVHRDLKPENIFVTEDGRIKILDFGLAKLTATIVATQSQSEVETRRVSTDPGTLMGTMPYMSPEQLKGENVDHRSDIFSFGAVFYEMLSGKRPFRGKSQAETASAILREDPPDLSDTNKTISPALERVVRHCLEKKPGERFHSARDLAFAIESLSEIAITSGQTATMPSLTKETGTYSHPSLRLVNNARIWMAITALVLLAAIVFAVLYFNRSSSDTRAVRLAFTPPSALAFNDTLPDAAVISPDGQKLAFTATGADGRNMLYVRDLASSEVKLVPGSQNAIEPFWSPDSRLIAFGSQGKLKRSDLTGADAQALCDATRMVGGTWNKDGTIVFAPNYRTALMQVSAQGGEPRPIYSKTGVNEAERDRFPYFLPDGRHFLFYREPGGIWIGLLNSPEVKQVAADTGVAVYASPGWLIFLQNDALVEQTFDAGKLTLTGEPIPLATGEINQPAVKRFSVSDNGILVWQPEWLRDYQLVWFDRQGKQTGVIDAPSKVNVGQDPYLSPDGKRLMVKRNENLWMIDLEKGTALRITSTFSQMPVWSPDGKRIVYAARDVKIKAANGSQEEEVLLKRIGFPSSWSADGRFIIFAEGGVKTRMDIWALPMFGEKKEYPLSQSPFDERSPQLSPDGRWLAYSSDETGDYEIYVQSFSAEGKLGSDKKRISPTGGRFPVWRHDGSELFFVAGDGSMMATAVETGGSEFQFNAPSALFKTRMLGWNFHEFDVSLDGQRFLIGTRIGEPSGPPPTVILNWTAALKK